MKITKSELRQRCIDNETAIATLEALLKEHGITRKQEPKLKVLDQSVFDGLDAKWRFAAVDKCGEVWACTDKVFASRDEVHLPSNNQDTIHIKGYYDASDWQNSLIERDKVELTGSDLCRAMLERGDKYVLSDVGGGHNVQVIGGWTEHGFTSRTNQFCLFRNPIPINNQGEPLTATDVGL